MFLDELERGAGGDRKSNAIKNDNVSPLISEYSQALEDNNIGKLQQLDGRFLLGEGLQNNKKRIAPILLFPSSFFYSKKTTYGDPNAKTIVPYTAFF